MTRRNLLLRLTLACAILLTAWGLILAFRLGNALQLQRQKEFDAYVVEHHCEAVTTRTVTDYNRTGYITSSSTHLETLWRCDDNEFWK